MTTRRWRGFTLIELMIAVAIVAILATIAIPSYRAHVLRSHRSAAQAVMMDLATREQQFLLTTRSYADTAALTASGYTLPAEVAQFYDFGVATAAGPRFTITFTPKGSQASDGNLTLDSEGGRTPAEKWAR